MGCSVAGPVGKQLKNDDGELCGIISGHAYGINDTFEIEADKVHKICRIRNPWGTKQVLEWNGKWSDNSPEQEIYSKELKLYNEEKPEEEVFKAEDDGEFLINFANWRDHYNNLFAARDFPDQWSAIRFNG